MWYRILCWASEIQCYMGDRLVSGSWGLDSRRCGMMVLGFDRPVSGRLAAIRRNPSRLCRS
jgi:hypothetical protein